MDTIRNRESGLEKLFQELIEKRLGDISGHPEEVIQAVRKGYREFISGYLNMVRQKEKRASDWIPNSLSLDVEVVDGMRHFFSDYQQLWREFDRINRHMDRLRGIDPLRQSRLYHQVAEEFLAGAERPGPPETSLAVLEKS
jgi:hypothetical protein